MAASAPGQIREDIGVLKATVGALDEKFDTLAASIERALDHAADERKELRRVVEGLKEQQSMLLPQAVANAVEAKHLAQRVETRVGALELHGAADATVQAGPRLNSIEQWRAEKVAAEKRWRWLAGLALAAAIAAGWLLSQLASALTLLDRLRPPPPPHS